MHNNPPGHATRSLPLEPPCIASTLKEPPTPRIQSRDLFGEGRRIIIEHGGREYALLITRQDKLVLNRSS